MSPTSHQRTSKEASKSSATPERPTVSPATVSDNFPEDLWSWGIDVSSRRIAFAFVNARETDHAVLRCDHGYDLARDLSSTGMRLAAFVNDHHKLYPAACAYVEEPMGRGNKTILASYTAITLTALALSVHAPIALVNIRTWRATVLGSGNADKGVASLFAKTMRGYRGGDPDIEEAICIACHGLTQEFT